MNWEEKFLAIQALNTATVSMREIGHWYVDQSNVSIGGDGMLRGSFGRGSTPQAAIEDHWSKLTDLPWNKYLVLNASGSDKHRKHVRWNGFMWDHVDVAGYK